MAARNRYATWRQHPGYRSERQFDRWARGTDEYNRFVWQPSSYDFPNYIAFLQNKGYDVNTGSDVRDIPKDLSLTREFTRVSESVHGYKTEDYQENRSAYNARGKLLVTLGRVRNLEEYHRLYPFQGRRSI
jgi:hypothetical protein